MYYTIKANNINVEYNGKTILDIDKLILYPTDRIGLVGFNGCGKTTLLNILSGKIECSGAIIEKNGIIRTIEQLNSHDNTENIDEDNDVLGALSKLSVAGKSKGHLSGGEETRIQIARTFRADTAGIIADEPTSNLDFEGIQFLTSELKKFDGMILLVSHDAEFLDNIVDKIWELKNGTITEYYGNYSDYIVQKEAENKSTQSMYNRYLEEKERLTKIAETQRQKVKEIEKSKKKNQQKNKSNFGGRLGHQSSVDSKEMKLAHKAKEVEARIMNMEKVEPPEREHVVKFKKSAVLELHNPYPIVGDKICKSFGDIVLFDNAKIVIPLNGKVAVTGANGSGKTTLFQMILNQEPCMKISPKAVIGFYSQTIYSCQDNATVIEYLMNRSEYNNSEIRGALINMGFGEDAYRKRMKCLSGGELVKIKLLSLLMGKYNILLLDEPTNYLDTASVSALEKMVKDYKGTIIFISHDRRFIKNVADMIYKIEGHRIVQIENLSM